MHTDTRYHWLPGYYTPLSRSVLWRGVFFYVCRLYIDMCTCRPGV